VKSIHASSFANIDKVLCTMSELPSSNSNSKKSGVWNSGTKGFNMMATAASSAAKTASSNIAAVSVGRSSSSSRRKVQDDADVSQHDHRGASETGSARDLTDSDKNMNDQEKYQGKSTNMFKTTYKTLKKGANKVNPLRMASAVVYSSRDGEEKTAVGSKSRILHQLGIDEAEDAVLSSVERRSAATKAGEDGFRPAGQ
jgi:hypothetical protein